jgi:Bacteriophage lambda head decoration protein D
MAKHPNTEPDRLDPRAGENDRIDTKDERNRVDALAGETPTQYASAYPIQTETPHATEFILTEANGQRSRANGFLAGAVTIKVGQPLKQTVAATATTPATFVAAALGADCNALAMYGGTGDGTNGLRIAVLVRDAEVNGNLINWGAITAPEQAIGLNTLAAAGIIARF